MAVITGELRNEWESGELRNEWESADRPRQLQLESMAQRFFLNGRCYFMQQAEEGRMESLATADVVKDVSMAYDVLATLSIGAASCRWVTPQSTTVRLVSRFYLFFFGKSNSKCVFCFTVYNL